MRPPTTLPAAMIAAMFNKVSSHSLVAFLARFPLVPRAAVWRLAPGALSPVQRAPNRRVANPGER
ncbi:MAG TPA: hypothetical protein VFW73_03980 [Lacipirellulaceae bacterium]|nr:hypothetical protein [Lacipirellulaceae bacterium]